RESRDRMGEVDVTVELEQLLLHAREDAVEQLMRLLGGERVEVDETFDLSTHENDRGRPRGHMEVGGIALHHALEQLVYGVGRRHNSIELSAGRHASFTPVNKCGRSPLRGSPTARETTDATNHESPPWKEHDPHEHQDPAAAGR